MTTTLVKNADRMMVSAAALDEGVELTFVDGRSSLIPFSDLPEVQRAAASRTWNCPRRMR